MIQYIIPTNGDASKTATSISNVSSKTKIHIEGESSKNIFQKYNSALERIDIDDNDVIVFLHDDIDIRDEHIEKKLEMYFDIKKNVGIAGVIGTNMFTEGGGWWMTDRQVYTRGRIIQGFSDGTEHPMIEMGGMDDSQIVAIDGCIMFMRGSVAKEFKFDEYIYDGYHFYDADTCFTLIEQGWDVGIIDILIKHDSEGPITENWNINRDKFIKKWVEKKYNFPITKDQFRKEP